MIGTWLSGPQAPADLDAVELRQHDVQDDEVEAAFGEPVERFAAVGGRDDLVAVLSKRIGEQGLHGRLVVDEQDARRVRLSHDALHPWRSPYR